MGYPGGHAEDDVSFKTIKLAYDRGINFFDTAEQYSSGRAEILLGKALKHFGWDRDDLGQLYQCVA